MTHVVCPWFLVVISAAILLNVKHHYEQFHGLEISEEVVENIVNLSDQYVKQRSFPDKALDLLDESCSWRKVSHNKKIVLLKKQIADAAKKDSEVVGYCFRSRCSAPYLCCLVST